MLRFNRSHLPLDQKMQDFWNMNGFLVIEDFYAHEECDKLIYKSEKLIDDFDADSVKSIFDTKNQNHVKVRRPSPSGGECWSFNRYRMFCYYLY